MNRFFHRANAEAAERRPFLHLPLHIVLLLISIGLALLFVFIELRQFYTSTSDYLQDSTASLEEIKFSRAKTELSENLTQLETIAQLAISDPQLQKLLESTTEKTFYVNSQMQKNLQQLLYKGSLIYLDRRSHQYHP